MCKKLLIIIIVAVISKALKAQEQAYKVITQDVMHFWEAYDSLKTGSDTLKIFQQIVIDNASMEFKAFIKQRNITARNYAAQLKAYPQFYSSIRKNSIRLCNSENKVRLLIQKLKDVYPDFKSADLCIAFGNFSTGGTIYLDGDKRYVYIGLEFHGLDSIVITSELNAARQDYVSRSNFFRTVIHELVHVQQEIHGEKVLKSYSGNKLIHSILREGIADFVAAFIYPKGNNGNYKEYGLLNEQRLITKLKNELWQQDKSYWIYNSNTVNNQPRDLGYFMGSRIAESYYLKYKKNPNIIKEIIEIKDIDKFLKKSGYFNL